MGKIIYVKNLEHSKHYLNIKLSLIHGSPDSPLCDRYSSWSLWVHTASEISIPRNNDNISILYLFNSSYSKLSENSPTSLSNIFVNVSSGMGNKRKYKQMGLYLTKGFLHSEGNHQQNEDILKP